MMGSHAPRVGVAATPPSDGVLDPRAQRIGVFCNGGSRLEEWTFFGDEIDFDFE